VASQAPAVLSVFGLEPLRIGGAEMFARELSVQLNRCGWRSVLCFHNQPPDNIRRFLDLPNVTLDVLPNAWSAGLEQHRTMAALLQRYRPRVLHLGYTPFLNLFSWLAWVHSVDRVFFTDHGSNPPDYVAARAPAWKRAAARTINWPLTRVLCVSEYNARCMRTRDLTPPGRIVRLYDAVDLTRPSGNGAGFRRRYGIPPERAVVLQVSWIIPEKGILDLLEAARRVLAQRRDVHFLIVGEGKYRAEYSAAAAADPVLADRVAFTGQVNDPMAEGVYEAADVVCQVSRWQEAFGWTIAEAMARSRPVVGTRVGGIPEVVTDGETGYVVPAGDAGAISEKLLALLADSGLRARMGAAGRRAVETRFNLQLAIAELLKLYGVQP
jgi:glycosyltransferase involved in cell wall biosynthesis